MTIAEFCKTHHITLTLRGADKNPNMPDPSMNHYRATLTRKEDDKTHSLTVPFSTGMAWRREPKITDVFDCLLSDYTTDDFHDWVRDFGYDLESREDTARAWKIHRACISHSRRLRDFLGVELLEQALECERE